MGHKKGSSDAGIERVVEYGGRAYCKDIRCPVQLELNTMERGTAEYLDTKDLCKQDCIYERKHFRRWLGDNGYSFEGGSIDGVCLAESAYEFHQWCKEREIKIVKRT